MSGTESGHDQADRVDSNGSSGGGSDAPDDGPRHAPTLADLTDAARHGDPASPTPPPASGTPAREQRAEGPRHAAPSLAELAAGGWTAPRAPRHAAPSLSDLAAVGERRPEAAPPPGDDEETPVARGAGLRPRHAARAEPDPDRRVPTLADLDVFAPQRWGPSTTELTGEVPVVGRGRHAAPDATERAPARETAAAPRTDRPVPPDRRRGRRAQGDAAPPRIGAAIVLVVALGAVVWLAFALAGLGGAPAKRAATPTTLPPAGSTPTTRAHSVVTAPPVRQVQVGQVVAFADSASTGIRQAAVQSYSVLTKANGGQLPDAGKQFVATELEVCAGAGGAPHGPSTSLFELVLPDGTMLTPLTSISAGNPSLSSGGSLRAGQCVSGYLTYEVDRGTTPVAVRYGAGNAVPVEWRLESST